MLSRKSKIENRKSEIRNQQYYVRTVIALAIAVVVLCLLAVIVYNLPPVHDRLAWRLDDLRTRIIYALKPPENAIFLPGGDQLPSPVIRTAQITPTLTETPPTLPTIAFETPLVSSPTPSPTATITPTPLPDQVTLPGVKYEDQHGRWNYCGPSNLSMALTFWGWKGNRDVVGKYIKPEDKDKNVMPYEMKDFVDTQTSGFSALIRYGGDVEMIKHMLAGGFPVLVEKGYMERDYTGKISWLGHYQYVTGYDDAQGVFIVQDTYIENGKNHKTNYAEFSAGWLTFDYLFLMVYPSERDQEVLTLLGPYADPAWANQHALDLATAGSETSTGLDLFFSWFNIGTSHVNLQQYVDAASAYDYAFSLYANLPEDGTRPYRIMWYQTGPYWAYYYSGRYQDVIDLASTTLYDTISEPLLEESFYWMALAKEALGNVQGAIDDLKESVRLNPNFTAGWEQLKRLGVEP